MDPRADAERAAGRPLLRHHAGGDPAHRAEAHARPAAAHHSEQGEHRAEDPPALLAGQRHAQARRAHAHARSGALRCDARLRAHQARDERPRGAARSARLQRRRAERGHPAAATRTHDHASQEWPARHRRRNRRGCTRARRRPHLARRQLRHSLRSGNVRSPHRAHGPRRTQR